MTTKTTSWAVVTGACLLALVASCNMPPKEWDPWDARPDGSDIDGDADGDADAEEDGEPEGDAEPDAQGDAEGDAPSDADDEGETDAEVVDLCEGVFCLPDEECDPATGECWSEGLDCGEIVSCWMDGGMAIEGILTCVVDGSAEGRRDFTALVTCLFQGCLMELLGATSDPMQLGLCAFENCPDELIPCAGGFF